MFKIIVRLYPLEHNLEFGTYTHLNQNSRVIHLEKEKLEICGVHMNFVTKYISVEIRFYFVSIMIVVINAHLKVIVANGSVPLLVCFTEVEQGICV